MLRERFDAGDPAAFAARVLARLPHAGSQWDVLAAWARPGLAAALIFAAALGYWTVLREARATPVADPTEIATGDRPIDNDALMAAVLGAGR
jgi:hypothetical protein